MRAIRILQANWLNEAVSGDRGTVKLVTDDMAADAVRLGIAEYAPEYGQFARPDAPAAQEIPVVKRPDAIEFPATRTPVDVPDDFGTSDAAAEEDPAETELRQPWSTASKAEWITWAAHGDHGQPPVTEEEAAAMSKIQLMSRYGGRL
jgi:hypothetical protein